MNPSLADEVIALIQRDIRMTVYRKVAFMGMGIGVIFGVCYIILKWVIA
jgi:hypothetical protein